MTKPFLVALATLALAGCSTTATPTFTSDGIPGYRVVCGGFFGDGDMGSCYQKAGDLCEGSGYQIKQTGVSSLIVACRSASASQAEAMQK